VAVVVAVGLLFACFLVACLALSDTVRATVTLWVAGKVMGAAALGVGVGMAVPLEALLVGG
jgi:hypothetical protein